MSPFLSLTMMTPSGVNMQGGSLNLSCFTCMARKAFLKPSQLFCRTATKDCNWGSVSHTRVGTSSWTRPTTGSATAVWRLTVHASTRPTMKRLSIDFSLLSKGSYESFPTVTAAEFLAVISVVVFVLHFRIAGW